jgi:hypothetical protein
MRRLAQAGCSGEARATGQHRRDLVCELPPAFAIRQVGLLLYGTVLRQEDDMPRIATSFDPSAVAWRRVTDPTCTEFKVDFEYSLLGYDLTAGRLDMLLRYAKGRGHCRRHRHVALTVTLVLDGEQHLIEIQPDGTRRSILRKKGEYTLAPADALPHLEHGGENGGTVVLSMSAPDGILFEYLDENMQNGYRLSIQEFVEAWDKEVPFGTPLATQAA